MFTTTTLLLAAVSPVLSLALVFIVFQLFKQGVSEQHTLPQIH